MKLYIKQKVFSIGDRYNIFDASGTPIIWVEGRILSFGAKISMYNANNQELFYIEQKVMRFLAEYDIYQQGRLCASVKKKLTFLRHELAIASSYGSFTLDGDAFGWNFNILKNGYPVGRIHKVIDWGDSYELDISDSEDIPFICALVIAVDNCIHNESNHS